MRFSSSKRLLARAGRASNRPRHKAGGNRTGRPTQVVIGSGDQPLLVEVRGEFKDAVSHASLLEDLGAVADLFGVLDLDVGRFSVDRVKVDPREGLVSSFVMLLEMRTLRRSTWTASDDESIRAIARVTGFRVRVIPRSA